MSLLRADYRTGALGAFAGLFTFGVFLLADRVDVYYAYRACMNTVNYSDCSRGVQDLWWMPLAFWHVLMFVLSSFVVHRYFADLRDSPFLLWQLVGIGALCAWGLSAASVFTLDTIMRGLEFDYDRLPGGRDLLYAAKFFAAVFAANTACASLLHSAARQYAPRPEPCAAHCPLDTRAAAGV
jgi:hypothetical protein